MRSLTEAHPDPHRLQRPSTPPPPEHAFHSLPA